MARISKTRPKILAGVNTVAQVKHEPYSEKETKTITFLSNIEIKHLKEGLTYVIIDKAFLDD